MFAKKNTRRKNKNASFEKDLVNETHAIFKNFPKARKWTLFGTSIRVFSKFLPNFVINLNSQAPVSPELASRGVFRLSRLSLNSQVKTVKQYTPQIEYGEFFDIISFSVTRLWKPQNAFEKNRLRFYLLWCLLDLYFWRLSEFISVQ